MPQAQGPVLQHLPATVPKMTPEPFVACNDSVGRRYKAFGRLKRVETAQNWQQNIEAWTFGEERAQKHLLRPEGKYE
jgi:hypothetical protein